LHVNKESGVEVGALFVAGGKIDKNGEGQLKNCFLTIWKLRIYSSGCSREEKQALRIPLNELTDSALKVRFRRQSEVKLSSVCPTSFRRKPRQFVAIRLIGEVGCA